MLRPLMLSLLTLGLVSIACATAPNGAPGGSDSAKSSTPSSSSSRSAPPPSTERSTDSTDSAAAAAEAEPDGMLAWVGDAAEAMMSDGDDDRAEGMAAPEAADPRKSAKRPPPHTREAEATPGSAYDAPTERTPPAGVLTAAQWRDLDHWSFWQDIVGARSQREDGGFANLMKAWRLDAGQRVPIVVHDGGRPVVDARVQIYDARERVIWTGRTDNRGEVSAFVDLLAPKTGPFGIEVVAGGKRATQWGATRGHRPHVVELKRAPPSPAAADVMLMMDTTGSMGDELRYLKSELTNVIDRVEVLASRRGQGLDLRLSMNFYRDHGDAYVVEGHPFTSDVGVAMSQLSRASVGGGGDFPEAVDAALDHAVTGHRWRKHARARVLLLVLDAPPHQDADSLKRVRAAAQKAAAEGVRIVPVAGSGIDKSTEIFLRALAASTGGTYVFLTDHSGVGGGHLEPTVGPHDVVRLNDLLVEVLDQALADVPSVRTAPAVASR